MVVQLRIDREVEDEGSSEESTGVAGVRGRSKVAEESDVALGVAGTWFVDINFCRTSRILSCRQALLGNTF